MTNINGHHVVAEARTWLKTPFAWGQSCKGVGCDCKGLISGVARNLDLPGAHSMEANFAGYAKKGIVNGEQLKAGMGVHFDVVENWKREPGDVLLLSVRGRTQHLAIYAGEERMIHCYSTGSMRVVESPLASVWLNALDSVWRWRYGR